MTWKVRTKVGTYCAQYGGTYHHLNEKGMCKCGYGPVERKKNQPHQYKRWL